MLPSQHDKHESAEEQVLHRVLQAEQEVDDAA
jgi:hypothetical protein